MALGRGEVRLTDPLVALEEHLGVLQGRELKHCTPLVGSWGVPVVKHLGKKETPVKTGTSLWGRRNNIPEESNNNNNRKLKEKKKKKEKEQKETPVKTGTSL